MEGTLEENNLDISKMENIKSDVEVSFEEVPVGTFKLEIEQMEEYDCTTTGVTEDTFIVDDGVETTIEISCTSNYIS